LPDCQPNGVSVAYSNSVMHSHPGRDSDSEFFTSANSNRQSDSIGVSDKFADMFAV
jgi:hypothetical protein